MTLDAVGIGIGSESQDVAVPKDRDPMPTNPKPERNPKARGRRGSKSKSKALKSEVMERLNLDAAGIDIGSESHYVAVPKDRDPMPVRCFEAFTLCLYELANWLEKCGIKTVAMESTGVYWIPLMQVPEEKGFEVLLVDPYKIKHVPGRKTDVLDCQWIQELHSLGLLTGAFRPSEEVCALRSYVRQRELQIRLLGDDTRRMHKALEEMNVKLGKVLSDITGKTGMLIIRSILAGERDPLRLARFRDARCRKDESEIAKSLEGIWRLEHLFALRQSVESYDFHQRTIEECGQAIATKLGDFAALPDLPALGKKRKSQSAHPLAFDAYGALYRVTGVDLTLVDGLDAPSVLTILSEVGLDMTKWRSGKAFASWLGLCPGNKVTGGKRLSSRTRRCANRAAKAFRLAAYGLQHSHSYLGAHYRRLKARLGAPKAITAAAHKLARIFYAMLRDRTAYADKGMEYYEEQYQERSLANLKRNAKRLGYELSPVQEPIFSPVEAERPSLEAALPAVA